MSIESKHKVIQQWIPILMAFIAVGSLVATIYFSYKQQERTKAVLSVQLAMKFDDLFDSDLMRDSRRNFAKAILEGKEPPNEDILGFFDTVGFYVKRGSVDIEVIWNEFGYYVLYYWPAVRSYVKQICDADHDETYYENVEWLYQNLLQEEASRLHRKMAQETPNKRALEDFLNDEANLPGLNSLQQIRHHSKTRGSHFK